MLLEQYVPGVVVQEVKNRYSRIISNWTYLSAYLSMEDPGPDELGVIIRCELEGRNRIDILNRLVGRLGSNLRRQLKVEIHELCEGSKNRRLPRGERKGDGGRVLQAPATTEGDTG